VFDVKFVLAARGFVEIDEQPWRNLSQASLSIHVDYPTALLATAATEPDFFFRLWK
jgi:hypothetical protein